MPPYPYGYPPPHGHRNSYTLNPDPYAQRGRSRSRSGAREGPAEIHIHNDMYQEGAEHGMPSPPMGYPPRGRSPYGYADYPAYGYGPPLMPYPTHSRSRSRGDEDERRRRYYEEYKQQEREREREKERAIEDHEREQSREKREEKEKLAEALRKQEEEKKAEKEKQLEAVRKYEQDKKDEEEKQKKAWEEYEAKKKQKEIEEKEKKEKEDEEYQERLQKHLAKLGYTQNQINVIVANEKDKKNESNALVRTPSAQQQLQLGQRPLVYPKIRREYILLETLKFYGLKWKYAEDDTDFIVILQEMTDRETDVLFAHTARLREKGKGTVLQIEDTGKGKKPQYMMVRRRSKSRGKSPSGAERLAEAVLRGPS